MHFSDLVLLSQYTEHIQTFSGNWRAVILNLVNGCFGCTFAHYPLLNVLWYVRGHLVTCEGMDNVPPCWTSPGFPLKKKKNLRCWLFMPSVFPLLFGGRLSCLAIDCVCFGQASLAKLLNYCGMSYKGREPRWLELCVE